MKKFNIVYGNHAHQGVHISDTLKLIKFGLQSVGHIAGISEKMQPGCYNILIENFTFDFVEMMKRVKTLDSSTRFIIVATEYLTDGRFNNFPWLKIKDTSHYSDNYLWEKRFNTFSLAAEMSDAIWHLSEKQVPVYQESFTSLPVGYLAHGFLPEMNRVHPNSKKQKDIDVLFTGTITSYREKILNTLTKAGIRVVTGKINTPDHLREDFVSRSRLALNLKQNPEWPYPSNSRFYYHIMNYSPLLTEQCEEVCDLDGYVEHVKSEHLVETVSQLLNSDLEAQSILRFEGLKKEQPMAPLMEHLLTQTELK